MSALAKLVLINEMLSNANYSSKNGRHTINCKKGLWGVDAPTQQQAVTEALHYYQQYRADGEYSDIDFCEALGLGGNDEQ